MGKKESMEDVIWNDAQQIVKRLEASNEKPILSAVR
jgi:hypothetical protein